MIEVRRSPTGNRHSGLLVSGPSAMPCILGRNGITRFKREGDNSTPSGNFRILYGMYREDRVTLPNTSLRMLAIGKDDGWCDAPESRNYNQPVRLPFGSSHEHLYRDDCLYDICLVLDYNISPRIRGRGSAIFFHLSSDAGTPTAGCVAVERENMLRLLPFLDDRTVMRIA